VPPSLAGLSFRSAHVRRDVPRALRLRERLRWQFMLGHPGNGCR
jgi:hypothetical protein